MRLWYRKEEKRSDGKGKRGAMRLERREAVRWRRKAWGYEAGKKRSSPMEKEHVRLWVRKEEKRSDGKGTCMTMGPVRGVAVQWAGRMGSNGNA
ncbi:hypothetical protein [Heyndrickxia sporothermodurans]|uniref:hypothetical protein n=1 Tax=Heyndrickxia sporothermodurans TaxID=46224 RepID=UPI00115861FE|nr:hypothetical protein [Heyndrickxia sporothermodurans]